MRVILGVTGCIGAYKATEIVRRLQDWGAEVVVVPTHNALKFVGTATWEALSGHPVCTQVFDDVPNVAHIRLAQEADLVLVAPATADFLARMACGRADDLLSSIILATQAPVIVCPAMHTAMWLNPATKANVDTLRSRNVMVKDPDSGRLTGKDSGPGRFPDPHEIVKIAIGGLTIEEFCSTCARQDLSGLKICVTAGGTREHIDPVRFIGNESSGRMGVEIARVAQLRGADVTLVASNLTVRPPSGVNVIQACSTGDLNAVMNDISLSQDAIVMAGAPADFAAAHPESKKIKKLGQSGLTLELQQTPDVLAGLCANRNGGQVIVGFAAETAANQEELLRLGRQKLSRKGADLLVLNDVSGGQVFAAEDNNVLIINSTGVLAEASGTKLSVAWAIIDAIKKF